MLKPDADRARAWHARREEYAGSDAAGRTSVAADEARLVRRTIIETIAEAGQGHVGGDLSVTDILTVLFDQVLRIDPEEPRWDDRDRFVLSKGHCAAALYSTLAQTGFFAPAELSTFMAPGSALNGHPNAVKVPGVETNTGPLGHGLPVAVGAALGGRLQDSQRRVFVVCGDGELQEGSNWEAIMSAAQFGLTNLTLVVDRNRLQQGARTEDTNGLDPLPDRLAAFGWEVREVDGHDYEALRTAFEPATEGKPVAVVANTIKGKGVSFMEDRVEWHHKVPTAEQVEQALKELA